MEEKPILNPAVTEDFFNRLNKNEDPGLKANLTADSLKNVITKEIKLKDFTDRLAKAKQEKVIIREVLLESELDIVNSMKQLKAVLRDSIERVNDLYESEVLKLQKLYKSEVFGSQLMRIIQTISKSGWCILMKDTGVYAYKCYDSLYDVYLGYKENGTILEYESPVCQLKAVYVNLIHPKITSGTIMLSTTGWHPNCDKEKFGVACTGTMEDVPIPLDDAEKLNLLLNEISSTYEKCHLDSAYFTPDIPHTVKKGSQWKVA